MTTPSQRRPSPVVIHGAVALAALVPAALVVATAGLAQGADAALASAAGAGVVAIVLLFGSTTVDLVAGAMPSASLLVAMMTYGLQLAVLTAFLVSASAAPFFATAAQRRWLFAGLGAVLLAWMVGQVVAAVKVRIPVYSLPATGAASGSGTAMDRTGSA